MSAPRPYNLVAELTYRCPLRCVYCSNPLEFRALRDALDAQAWVRVLREAAELGVVHVGLTGGEPTLRDDLTEIVRGAAEAGLYPHLVTAGTTLSFDGLADLCLAGLRSVQLSVQDARPAASDRLAGAETFARKVAFAGTVKELGLPLSLNVVLHRHNLDHVRELIAFARRLEVDRLELANTQYYGWALSNRAALLPTREQVERARVEVERARAAGEKPEIIFVLPDYLRDRPKACMGGWGRRNLVVRPDGLVLPCHAAGEIPDLRFWSATEHPLRDCWEASPGMNAFRGESWMPEPCRSCERRGRDFGGCRCQAFLLAGDAAATDPACALSPHHGVVLRARARAGDDAELVYRGERT